MALHDLSHELGSGMPYPGDPPASVTPDATMRENDYRTATVDCSTHSGTHVDAPAHVVEDGATLGEFGPAAFEFDAVVVDCTDVGARGEIPPGRVPATDADLVVFHTGSGVRWGDESYFDHPYLVESAAERCAEQDCAVGIDAPNVDPTPTDRATENEPEGYPAHYALLGDGRLILENLTNLDALGRRVRVRAHPLPIDADGAPARVVAVTE